MNTFNRIKKCRISDDSSLKTIMNLGEIHFSGIFPESVDTEIPTAPLELVLSEKSGLVQLAHNFDPKYMYGDNYGYRSGLNAHMVSHLNSMVKDIESEVDISDNDVIVDIGSNDGTLLNQYTNRKCSFFGVDPSAGKFKEYYDKDINIIEDFFSASLIQEVTNKKAKVLTSIAMFYDLQDPIDFAKDVYKILDADGVWILEMSYLPMMLQTNSVDTICHEHLEYYSIHALKNIFEASGFFIHKISTNDINGGSVNIILKKTENNDLIPITNWYLNNEFELSITQTKGFEGFVDRVFSNFSQLKSLIYRLKNMNYNVAGLGASTKGNITLSYANFNYDVIDFIIEVNPNKYNRYTPGTNIPIISEKEAQKRNIDYLLVLPWHFRTNIIPRYKQMFPKVKLIFPMPYVEIV
jgi:hypothetical protein